MLGSPGVVPARADVLPEWWDAAPAAGADGAAAHGQDGPALEEEAIRVPRIELDAEQVRSLSQRRASGAASRYGMQPGDILQVSVWREPELDREVQVSPDGFVALPLVGEVPVAGLSVEEVRVEVLRRLTEFVPRAVVTVSLKEMRGNRVYVLGKVNRPGVYPYFDSLDVMQALSLAGGGARFAKLDRISIIRRDGERQQAIGFDYLEVERGEALEQNIQLRSGDIVLVP